MRSLFKLGLVLLVSGIGLAACGDTSTKPPQGARVYIRNDDLRRINKGLATGNFVFTIPTGTKSPPSSCPAPTKPGCIWICSGNDPLDGIDDDTCSTNTYCCFGCGDGGRDVCQPGS